LIHFKQRFNVTEHLKHAKDEFFSLIHLTAQTLTNIFLKPYGKMLKSFTFGLANWCWLNRGSSCLNLESESRFVFSKFGFEGGFDANSVEVEERGFVAGRRGSFFAVVGASVVAVGPFAVDGNPVLVDLVRAPPVNNFRTFVDVKHLWF
jgi:hypothetical protein